MLKPDLKIIQSFAVIAKQYDLVLEFLDNWYRFELERLPYVTNNLAVSQGRCQVLSELVKLIREAPETVAKQSSPLPFPHTDRSE